MGLQEWNFIEIGPYRKDMLLNKIFPGRISQQKWSWLSREMTRIRQFLFTAHFGIHPLLVLTNPFSPQLQGNSKLEAAALFGALRELYPSDPR